MSAVKIKEDLYWIGAQDFDLRVFDVVMRTEYGTSYNSYILKTPEYTVLFETVKLKFFDTFINNIKEVCDPADIDYIVVDHTEPDHAGSLEKLLDYTPKAKVLASSIALNFLGEICNREIPGQAVADNQVIELDRYKLKFLSVPFLHWPDSIYTYIEGLDTLVTCDSFGCHYADDKICNDLIEGNFEPAYKYYFDMIMGPFKPHVQYALNRIKEYNFDTICPGHGPVLRDNLDYYIDLYDKWSQVPEKVKGDKPSVVIPYVAAYGYTEELAHKIIAGIKEEIDADIKLYDMVYADKEKVKEDMANADGILTGSPTVNGDALPPVMDLIMEMNGILHGGKVAGAFGSYGWSGEAPEMLMARLKVLRMKTVEPALRVNFKPGEADIAEAKKYGKKFGKKLKEEWVKLGDTADGKTYWRCTVCGEIFEGALPPLSCPVCGAGSEAFIEYIPEVINYRNDRELKVVIIGSGAAALSAATAVRKRNDKAEIDIYTSEAEFPYYRPVLTRAISEKINDSEYFIHSKQYYKDNRINIHFESAVSAIDKDGKTVEVNGKSVAFDRLIISTGARCFVPPIQGADLPEVITVREQSDVDKLHGLLGDSPKRVVVIGGGLLGLEAASHLVDVKHEVTVIESAPRILPRQLDEGGASILADVIANSNITLKKGYFVDEILGEDHVEGVKTKEGETIPCEVVIISTGIHSNTELAKAAGIKVDRGIVVDARMRTSQDDIYAAGDCAIFEERVDGIWESALDQGNVAGANVAGDDKSYSHKTFSATLNAFGTSCISIGDIGKDENSDYSVVTTKDEINDRYKAIYFKNGKLCGGILIGDTRLTNQLLSGVGKGFDAEEASDNKLI